MQIEPNECSSLVLLSVLLVLFYLFIVLHPAKYLFISFI